MGFGGCCRINSDFFGKGKSPLDVQRAFSRVVGFVSPNVLDGGGFRFLVMPFVFLLGYLCFGFELGKADGEGGEDALEAKGDE
jgi:hypothetical protein